MSGLKDPSVLENISSCKNLLFDKTGTLAYGRPKLTEIVTGEGFTEKETLSLVASLERYSRHPLSSAILEAAKGAGVFCEFHQVEGDPAEETVAFAQEHHSDLIVMGHRGLGGFKEMLLGSVSNKVAHTADCPVLIAR